MKYDIVCVLSNKRASLIKYLCNVNVFKAITLLLLLFICIIIINNITIKAIDA